MFSHSSEDLGVYTDHDDLQEVTHLLDMHINPLSHSDVWGIDLYTETLRILYEHAPGH